MIQVLKTFTLYDVQGKQKQQKRTTTFFEFCNASSGVLFCTDVAARGLDIPAVDWIIQYDPPDDPKVCTVAIMCVIWVIKPAPRFNLETQKCGESTPLCGGDLNDRSLSSTKLCLQK